MSLVSIDTHAFVKRITAAGMPVAQAEVLAETFAERPAPVTKGAVTQAVETLGRAVDKRLAALEKGQAELKSGQTELKSDVAELKNDVAELKSGQAELKSGQAELKNGHAILMDNQIETNRALAAIMAHLGIPKP